MLSDLKHTFRLLRRAPGFACAAVLLLALGVGVTTAMSIQFEPEWSGAAMYVLMAVILLVRPRGLLGEKWERFE